MAAVNAVRSKARDAVFAAGGRGFVRFLPDGEEALLVSDAPRRCQNPSALLCACGAAGFGAEERDGLLLLISMENRKWYISTTGYGITAFTDAGIQYIGNKLQEPLSDEDYAAAFNTFAELCDDFITEARTGTPYDSSNMPKEPMKRGWILVAIIVGFILSFITVGNMKGKLKTVRFQPAANSYMKAGSMNITESRDMFLYNTVTRTAKPKANDSDSEGSSTHTSSSGSTHGGGGGSF